MINKVQFHTQSCAAQKIYNSAQSANKNYFSGANLMTKADNVSFTGTPNMLIDKSVISFDAKYLMIDFIKVITKLQEKFAKLACKSDGEVRVDFGRLGTNSVPFDFSMCSTLPHSKDYTNYTFVSSNIDLHTPSKTEIYSSNKIGVKEFDYNLNSDKKRFGSLNFKLDENSGHLNITDGYMAENKISPLDAAILLDNQVNRYFPTLITNLEKISLDDIKPEPRLSFSNFI